ncbi:MAG: DUF1353 domain-containing protein [Campylobacter sp.]
MQNTVKRPLLKPFDKDKFELMQDYEIDPANLGLNAKKIKIPKGYKTNGANVPRLFWCIFAPNSPEYLSAVLVHDFLCDEAELKFKSDKRHGRDLFLVADTVLKQMMSELGVKKLKFQCFYYACRAWHKLRYGG